MNYKRNATNHTHLIAIFHHKFNLLHSHFQNDSTDPPTIQTTDNK